jgi:hypothetical protein
MDKRVLFSVLETVTVGSTVGLSFGAPFTELTGDYTVVVSKTGRGRGGSRVLEVHPVSNPDDVFGALVIDGKEKALGTATSDVILAITFDGVTHGDATQPETVAEVDTGDDAPVTKHSEVAVAATPRVTKRQSRAAAKESTLSALSLAVTKALGDVLLQNPNSNFKLVGRGTNSPITGEWKVTSFTKDTGILRMECVELAPERRDENGNAVPPRTLSFDSSVDGHNLKDAEVLFVS